jgi:predicted Abi (CAAX) family protease
MKYAACLALAFAGCASGAPCSVAPAARVSVAPVQTLGFRPEVATVAKMPIEVTECVGGTCKAVFDDLIAGAKCVIETLLPTVNPAPSAPQYAAPAPCLPAAALPKAGPACGR